MRENESKDFYISHKGELLIWLIIVLFVVAFYSLKTIHQEKNDINDYQIFLQDVDGLIVGSPVRMMGIEVGHVIKIKPMKNDVYVKFILTNPDVYIPRGSVATVEFSGMAGSKSLELYLPDKKTYIDETSPILAVNPPKRLHDALGLLNDMYKKLNSIFYAGSSFGNKLNEINIDSAVKNNSDIKEFVKFSEKFIIDTDNKASGLRPLWKKGEKNAK